MIVARGVLPTPNLLLHQSLAHVTTRSTQTLKQQETVAHCIKQELDGQHEIAENFLRAHEKKHKERNALIQTQKRELEQKERLLVARKMKMLAEVDSVLGTQVVLEGWKMVGSAGDKDVEVSTALGYTCLLLISLQSYLNLRLQYPLKFQGSRSSIFLGDKECALYSVSRPLDKHKFENSLGYLHQNLRQVLKALGQSGEGEAGTLVGQVMEQLRKFRG